MVARHVSWRRDRPRPSGRAGLKTQREQGGDLHEPHAEIAPETSGIALKPEPHLKRCRQNIRPAFRRVCSLLEFHQDTHVTKCSITPPRHRGPSEQTRGVGFASGRRRKTPARRRADAPCLQQLIRNNTHDLIMVKHVIYDVICWTRGSHLAYDVLLALGSNASMIYPRSGRGNSPLRLNLQDRGSFGWPQALSQTFKTSLLLLSHCSKTENQPPHHFSDPITCR